MVSAKVCTSAYKVTGRSSNWLGMVDNLHTELKVLLLASITAIAKVVSSILSGIPDITLLLNFIQCEPEVYPHLKGGIPPINVILYLNGTLTKVLGSISRVNILPTLRVKTCLLNVVFLVKLTSASTIEYSPLNCGMPISTIPFNMNPMGSAERFLS